MEHSIVTNPLHHIEVTLAIHASTLRKPVVESIELTLRTPRRHTVQEVMTMALSNTTQDHDEIRTWAEARGAKPAEVASTEKNGQTGILRIEFPKAKNHNDSNLKEISWDEFFEKFDASGLALVYQDVTKEGAESNFNKLIHPDDAAPKKAAKRSSSAASAGKKTSTKQSPAKSSPASSSHAAKAPAKKSAAKSAKAKQG
jgi:hypothetical protein